MSGKALAAGVCYTPRMNRNMDLIRAILLALARHPHGFAPDEIAIDQATAEEVGYHVHLLIQAGLVDGDDVSHLTSPSPQARAVSLTWSGHEFLDACRNLDRWERAKQIVRRVGDSSFAVWKQVLADLVTKSLGL